jgi:DNA replication protein DnaC
MPRQKRPALAPDLGGATALAAAGADGDLLARLRAHLDRLGLTEIEPRLEEHLAWAHRERPAPLVLLERVFGEAAGKKRERRVERRIDRSGLRVRKTLEAFDWAFQPKLDRAAVESIASLRFVDQHEDVLITGQSGTGKSHILQAIALRACQREIQVRYARCVDLLDDLYAGLGDGSYPERLGRWARTELLVIDDVGLGQVKRTGDEPTAAHMLFNLLDRRHLRASTAITSNIKLSAWGKYLADATITASILDRLAMNSRRLDIDGPSYRQHLAQQRAKSAPDAHATDGQ